MSQVPENVKRIVADMQTRLEAAENRNYQLECKMKLVRGELAGYKLAVRLLGRFGQLTAAFCGYIGRIQATYK